MSTRAPGLGRSGQIKVGSTDFEIGGSVLPLERAVRIALAGLEHLTQLAEGGRDVDPERWRRLGYLCALAVGVRPT